MSDHSLHPTLTALAEHIREHGAVRAIRPEPAGARMYRDTYRTRWGHAEYLIDLDRRGRPRAIKLLEPLQAYSTEGAAVWAAHHRYVQLGHVVYRGSRGRVTPTHATEVLAQLILFRQGGQQSPSRSRVVVVE